MHDSRLAHRTEIAPDDGAFMTVAAMPRSARAALWMHGIAGLLWLALALIVRHRGDAVLSLPHGWAMGAQSQSNALVLLVLATIQDTGAAIGYLVVFCLGVAAGMAALTTVIGLPFWIARARSQQINRWLTVGSGVLSLAFGLYLGYQIGFVDGLFTGDFRWEPA